MDYRSLDRQLGKHHTKRLACPDCGDRTMTVWRVKGSDKISRECFTCAIAETFKKDDPPADSNRRFQPQKDEGPPPTDPNDPGPQPPPVINGKRHRRNRDFQGFLSSTEFIEKMQPPDYLVDRLLLRGSTYTLTGNTGHCKTLIALLLAIKIALGEWFCGRKCKQGKVAFFAGENPDNVKTQFYAMCAELGIDHRTVPIIWHPGVFTISEAREKIKAALAQHTDLAFCAYDSLQAYFAGDDDSQNMQMLDAALDFRSLTEDHPGRPVGLILAHPVKNASRDSLLPRGGSALNNELDGNLTVWLDNDIAALHWHGKFRGIPFDPIKLEKALIKPEGLVDANGDQMACTIVRPLGEQREADLARDHNHREIRILEILNADPKITQSALATLLGVARSTVQKALDELRSKKWIRKYNDAHKLTKEGKTALELAGKRT